MPGTPAARCGRPEEGRGLAGEAAQAFAETRAAAAKLAVRLP